jgi:hypothetical protein
MALVLTLLNVVVGLQGQVIIMMEALGRVVKQLVMGLEFVMGLHQIIVIIVQGMTRVIVMVMLVGGRGGLVMIVLPLMGCVMIVI